MKDVFDLEQAALKDVRALGGEVVEVPLKPDRHAPKYLELLGEDLARFMCDFTGRGYAMTRETLSAGDTRYVREPGYEAFGLKVFSDGQRIVVGRVAVLMDEMILRNYVKHLKRLLIPIPETPAVTIDLPDSWGSVSIPDAHPGVADEPPPDDAAGPGSSENEKPAPEGG